MTAIKISLAFFLLISMLSCKDQNYDIDLSEAIMKVTNCIEGNNNCPDTIYISPNTVPLDLFISKRFENCVDEYSEYRSYNFNLNYKKALEGNEVIVRNFEFNKKWIPPRSSSTLKAFVIFSPTIINDDRIIVFINKYLSGKNISSNACHFIKRQNNIEFIKCDCSHNPY